MMHRIRESRELMIDDGQHDEQQHHEGVEGSASNGGTPAFEFVIPDEESSPSSVVC